MNGLARAQDEFLACVLDDAAPLPAGWDEQRAAGMIVYRNAYRSRLIDALRETFERTERLVGEDAFRRAAAHHLISHRPQGWTIDRAGEGFAGTCAELFAHDLDVAEVAWLEWAMDRAFTAADCEPLTVAGFGAATVAFGNEQWDALSLDLMPGTALRSVKHDLLKLWGSLAGPGGDPQVETLRQPEWVLLWREVERPVFVHVPEHEGLALSALQRDGTFGGICAALAKTFGREEATALAGAMLLRWLELGVVRALRTE